MFFVQLGLSTIVWIGTVWTLVRQRSMLFSRASTLGRGQRAAFALGALVLSVVCLGLGMAMLAIGGLGPKGLSWWGWPTITLAGSAFVALQTFGLVPLVLNAVTRKGAGSSDTVDVDRP